MTPRTGLTTRLRELPTAKYVFAALVATLLVVGVGQWIPLVGLTTLYLGLPLWLWVQLVIVAAMLVISWVAVSVWSEANSIDESTSSTGGQL